MNTSGEAADQVVRMSLEVGEAALKISGTGAKHLAVMLYTVLKEKKKTKGRVRLETLVKSGRPLTVFSVKESLQKKTEQCVEERKHLRYKIRADRPEEEIEKMKEQIKVLTEKIGTLRKEAALCDGIAARSKVIEEKFKTVREEKEKKEEQSHEHIRRSR